MGNSGRAQGLRVRVEGTVTSAAEYNLALGQRRADAVKRA
jgi:outer membrane protein OmpA-like peptidoglycan-associated protein